MEAGRKRDAVRVHGSFRLGNGDDLLYLNLL